MKRIIATATAALIGTAAFADNSDRYNDMRLDTSKTDATEYSDSVRGDREGLSTKAQDLRLDTSDNTPEADTTYSTSGDIRSPGQGFPYGGYGPGNDSR